MNYELSIDMLLKEIRTVSLGKNRMYLALLENN